MTTKLYRPCVGICLINNQGRVFAGERIDTPNAWQMPQGGVDGGEDLERAAYRELLEEIGTDKAEIITLHPKPLTYDLPADVASRLWNGKYAGQSQTWFYMRFTGQDSDINLSAFDPPEFKQWLWMDAQELKHKIVPFKIDTYDAVLDYLTTSILD